MDDNSKYVLEDLESTDIASPGPELDMPPALPPSFRRKWLRRAIVLAVVIIVAILVLVLLGRKSTSKSTTVIVNTQSLSAGTLQKIEQQQPGSKASEQLTIAPNTLFKSNVSVQGTTSLAKNVQIGGNLSVDGSTTIGSNLSVSGLISAGSLSVSSLNIKTLQLSGDFNLGGHIIPTGSKPTIATSVASSGGTATIDGTDTAGTITITTGGGKQTAGELAIISFAKAFATNPRLQLTPVNAASAGLQYYVSQSPKFFSIETATTPDAGVNYVFNYFVTQ